MHLPSPDRRRASGLVLAAVAAALQVSVQAAPAAAAVTPKVSEARIWFSPDPAPFAEAGGGSVDYEQLWAAGSPWALAQTRTAVFQLRMGYVEQATDGQLSATLRFLTAHGIALAIEAAGLDRTTCGLGVEGFQLPGEVEASAQRIKSLGGVIGYVAMDEPFATYYSTATNACHWPVDRIAFELYTNVTRLRAIFPDIVVGDEEPYLAAGATASQAVADLEHWIDTYRLVTGEPLPFMHLDVDWRVAGWPAAARSLEEYARSHGVSPGQIYNGQGGSSDAGWMQLAEARMATYERQAGGRPDHAVIMSWNYYPRRVVPESDPAAFTYLLNYYYSNHVAAGPFTPVTPYRVLDTRTATRLGPDQSLDVPVAGTGGPGGVPQAGVGAVAVNVTVTNATSPGYLTLYPSGPYTRPLASNLNFAAGQTAANLAQVSLGQGGRLSVYNASGFADVLLDVQGWFGLRRVPGTAGLYRPMAAPERILDTRPASQVGPFGNPFPANASRILPVSQRLPDPRASAVLVNVTAVDGTTPSYLTIYPASDPVRPNSSNVNFASAVVVPNRAVVRLGAGGNLAVYNAAGQVDVVVDLIGWFTDGTDPGAGGGLYHSLSPSRVYDSRGGGALSPGESRWLKLAGTGGLPPADVGSFVANLTATEAAAGTYLIAYPSDSGVPNASDLNPAPGQTVANLITVRLGGDGAFRVYDAAAQVDLLIDVVGWYG